jgi:YD repeat-containing protein
MEEVVNGTVRREYAYGLQRIDENQIINNTWTPSFYGYDGMGNVRQLTNAAGAVTDTYTYDAFGNPLNIECFALPVSMRDWLIEAQAAKS